MMMMMMMIMQQQVLNHKRFEEEYSEEDEDETKIKRSGLNLLYITITTLYYTILQLTGSKHLLVTVLRNFVLEYSLLAR